MFVILVYPYRHGGFQVTITGCPVDPLLCVLCMLKRSEYNIRFRKISLVTILLLLILASYIRKDKLIFKYQQSVVEGPQKAESMEAFEYIKYVTDKNATIAFFKPRVLAFYTGRKSVAIENISDSDKFLSAVDKFGINYILTIRSIAIYMIVLY